MEFPCWMYHSAHGARLFECAEDFASAGDGWADSPEAAKSATRERDMKIAASVRKSAKGG